MHRIALVLAVLAVPTIAHAGSCPSCTSSEDCADPAGGPAFCVLHESDVGCGATVQICCPGQGCAITGTGRPSCEATGTCTVVDEAIDAGVIDAGAGDAGPGDAGTPGTLDSGVVVLDATTGSGLDASSDVGGRVGACGCRIGSRTSPLAPASVIAIVAAWMIRRRRA